MKRSFRFTRVITGVLLALALTLPTSCSTVPITGRRQLNLIPNSTMLSMSSQQYGQFIKQSQLSTNKTQTAMVKRVGTRIAGAVGKYFAQQDMEGQLRGYNWQFNLVNNKEANAWAMPGGKVVVYTGILPYTQTETGLAVVMAHEIAHAVAEHGNERMSQALLTQMGGMALSQALRSKPTQTRQLWMSAFGAGATYGVLLPFSRTQESEADRLGLIFMAMAGYDPRQAVTFWQRMAQQNKAAPPEFLSTHPSNATRIRNIQREVPEAMGYYAAR